MYKYFYIPKVNFWILLLNKPRKIKNLEKYIRKNKKKERIRVKQEDRNREREYVKERNREQETKKLQVYKKLYIETNK